jgi:hypothetical protein
VVAQRRVEFHACLEQRLVRVLEFLLEVGGLLAAVDVVAHHHDNVEFELLTPRRQALAGLVLRPRAGAGVADHREVE